ncbi:DNA-binding response regulator [Actinoplanes italicus]|uniref:DNA-binding NarL/FixJ family response regulator n=1 Tax=Actinoplanes italicus TaxID=113567 RepID=A0A2T0JB07_9ACTN|nr:response regulator transcription factor [Actinoplanes italicus]PRX04728.1 DNA-binding NarL/FixJ family response regulator [Actinoplanes italicus]GIE37029.1 DNA-binding response regulator [Actinoplanes italicus]
MAITVLLADDQALVRNGLCMMLSVHPDLDVVGEAGNGAEAVMMARELTPDVVVMDLNMPGMDGIEATRQLTADNFTPNPDYTAKVLILTGLGDDEHVYAALRAGASGFVLKDAAPAELATAVSCVANGNGYLAPAVTRGVIAGIVTPPSPTRPVPGILDRLTPREREILTLMAGGLTNEDIAARLHLAMATVKTHVCRIIMRLEVHDRTQAVVIAYQNNLVPRG